MMDAPGTLPLTTALQLSDPDVALSLVKRLFGKQPHDTMVALGFTRQCLTAVVSAHLPTLSPPLPALMQDLTGLLVQHRVTETITVGYGAAAYMTSALTGLQGMLDRVGIIQMATVHYQNGRYCLPLCPQPGRCCPAENILWNPDQGDPAAIAALQAHTPVIHTIYPSRRSLRSIRQPCPTGGARR
ncbi:hypothetical protein ACQPYK_49455 (plasmid) [Streptosporangium sp. CA-135522]|uniref:hypothetical protein n=1 Tax=Streptosporangium sp. CA-135522 TaxID=3240072 RepID=UPI003D91C543